MSSENLPIVLHVPEKNGQNEEIEDAEFEELPDSEPPKGKPELIYEGIIPDSSEPESAEKLVGVRERLGLSGPENVHGEGAGKEIQLIPNISPENAMVVAESREVISSVEGNPEIKEAGNSPEEGVEGNDSEIGPEEDEQETSGTRVEGTEDPIPTKKKSWGEKIGTERMRTIGKWGLGIGGTAAAVGLGVAANAALFGAFGVAPATAGVGLSMAGIWAGAGFVGAMVMMDIFYWKLGTTLLVDGYKWIAGNISKFMGGAGSGGSKPAAKAPAGGGSHGGGH